MYNQFDIVRIGFPFSDITDYKIRPCVVVSSGEKFNHKTGLITLAMITSSSKLQLPFDTVIEDYEGTGLGVKCLIRMKFFTANSNTILSKLGKLSEADSKKLKIALQELFL